jgi:hypothetical protein
MEVVQCPKCKRRPYTFMSYLEMRWFCDKCNHSFDTFKNFGKCPICNHEHKKTVCLSCGEISNHLEFYNEDFSANWIENGQLKQEKYVGELKEGKYHGKGTYSNYKYGFIYTGEWKEGKEHGQGTCNYANGGKYVGEWKDGKRDGLGTMETIGRYVGEWKEGKEHGKGTYTFINGDKGWWKEGLWQEGLLIKHMSLPFQEDEKKLILQLNQKK